MNICIDKNEKLTLDFIVGFLKGWDDIDYPISLKVRDGTITAENVNGAKAAELVQKVGISSPKEDNLTILINVDVKSQFPL